MNLRDLTKSEIPMHYNFDMRLSGSEIRETKPLLLGWFMFEIQYEEKNCVKRHCNEIEETSYGGFVAKILEVLRKMRKRNAAFGKFRTNRSRSTLAEEISWRLGLTADADGAVGFRKQFSGDSAKLFPPRAVDEKLSAFCGYE